MNKELVCKFEEKIGKDYKNLTGMVVMQGGDTVYEKYFQECDETSKVHVYSVTKSILSVLIGIAVDQGLIATVDEKVLNFFPDYSAKKGNKRIADITLRDILTMTAPYTYLISPYVKYFTSDDYLTFSLDHLGGRGKVGKFRYAPLIGPDIFSGIITSATGHSVLDYAKENLFEPLGITVEKSIIFQSKEEQMDFNKATRVNGWAADTNGLNTGGWGLTLSTKDMAKIGEMMRNNGCYNGQNIVSEQWVMESTSAKSRWEKIPMSYGYLWWVENANCFAAMGDGGNVIYVNREKSLVVAISSLFLPNVTDRIDFIKEYVEPAL